MLKMAGIELNIGKLFLVQKIRSFFSISHIEVLIGISLL